MHQLRNHERLLVNKECTAMAPDERLGLIESGAFQMLAVFHPRAALHVAAMVRSAKGVPGYAWVQCLDCAADFDFEQLGDWELTDESAAALERTMCISACSYRYGN
jgi:hypothetical protein